MASYNLGPLHDHRPLLRVVKAFIRDDDAGALPPLSCRLIRHPVFLQRLFEFDIIAGAKPIPPIVYTPEEEDRLIAADGWTKQDTEGGRPYWYKPGVKSTWEKPKPRKPSVMETETRVLAAAEPCDLLATCMFLREDVQEFAVAGLLMAIEKTFAGNFHFRQRVTVLKMMLAIEEEAHEDRVDLVSRQLMKRIHALRDDEGPGVESLAQHQKWARMKALMGAFEDLQEANLLGKAAIEEDFAWYDAWGEEHRVRLRISLDDLQGKWTNSENQSIKITANHCTFDGANPVEIFYHESGTWAVPGWVLSQERSSPENMYWVSMSKRHESTEWVRPNKRSYLQPHVTMGPHTRDQYDSLVYTDSYTYPSNTTI